MTRQIAREIQAEAARWVARMDGALWGEAEEAELQSWLAADPRRPGALLQAQAAWGTLDAIRRGIGDDHDGGADADRADAAFVSRAGMGRRRLLIGGGAALAASIAGGLVQLGNGLAEHDSLFLSEQPEHGADARHR